MASHSNHRCGRSCMLPSSKLCQFERSTWREVYSNFRLLTTIRLVATQQLLKTAISSLLSQLWHFLHHVRLEAFTCSLHWSDAHRHTWSVRLVHQLEGLPGSVQRHATGFQDCSCTRSGCHCRQWAIKVHRLCLWRVAWEYSTVQ